MAKFTPASIKKTLAAIGSETLDIDTKLLNGSLDVSSGFSFTDKFKKYLEYSQKSNKGLEDWEHMDFAMDAAKMDFLMHYKPKEFKKYDKESITALIADNFADISEALNNVINHREVNKHLSGSHKKAAITALVGHILDTINREGRVPFLSLSGRTKASKEDLEYLNGGFEFDTGKIVLDR